jgi:hypothetical protein
MRIFRGTLKAFRLGDGRRRAKSRMFEIPPPFDLTAPRHGTHQTMAMPIGNRIQRTRTSVGAPVSGGARAAPRGFFVQAKPAHQSNGVSTQPVRAKKEQEDPMATFGVRKLRQTAARAPDPIRPFPVMPQPPPQAQALSPTQLEDQAQAWFEDMASRENGFAPLKTRLERQFEDLRIEVEGSRVRIRELEKVIATLQSTAPPVIQADPSHVNGASPSPLAAP